MARQAETSLDKNVLESRSFLQLNYDPLVLSEANLDSVCTQFHGVEDEVPELGDLLRESIVKYCSVIDEKLTQIERFKSHNAVYRNTIYFIQKLATEDAANVPRVRWTKIELIKKVLLRFSLAYSVVSSEEARRELESLLAKTTIYLDDEEFNIVHSHAQRLLLAKAKLDEVTHKVFQYPSQQILEEIRIKYFKNYKAAEAYAHLHRRILFGMSILFLIFILRNIVSLWRSAQKLAEANSDLENKVRIRTLEVEKSKETIVQQQQKLIFSAKMSSLGEMAGGIAHEINTPLAVIAMRSDQLLECAQEGDLQPEDVTRSLEIIRRTTDRIAKIINGLRFFARDASKCSVQETSINSIISDTLSFCNERFSVHGVQLEFLDTTSGKIHIHCRSVEISQVFLNLLNNAFDAIVDLNDKWVRIELRDLDDYIEVSFTDSGLGIPEGVREKILQPFFTTKDVGKGTGLGLSIAHGIIEGHQGKLYLDLTSKNTRFAIVLPKTQQPAMPLSGIAS